MTLYFIRHSESIKSKEDRHGGLGLPLTNQGIVDTRELISFLKYKEKLEFQRIQFFCSDLIQVRETARIIEETLDVKFEISSQVKNISLGVLDGLSKEEAKRKYPSVAENLEKWRKGQIKIDEFIVPGAETMTEFYNRIFGFIKSLINERSTSVVIGTRSVGVAIANIFDSFTEKIDMNKYKRYLYHPSSVSKFTFTDKPYIEFLNFNEYLSIKPEYPDI